MSSWGGESGRNGSFRGARQDRTGAKLPLPSPSGDRYNRCGSVSALMKRLHDDARSLEILNDLNSGHIRHSHSHTICTHSAQCSFSNLFNYIHFGPFDPFRRLLRNYIRTVHVYSHRLGGEQLRNHNLHSRRISISDAPIYFRNSLFHISCEYDLGHESSPKRHCLHQDLDRTSPRRA